MHKTRQVYKETNLNGKTNVQNEKNVQVTPVYKVKQMQKTRPV